MSRAAELEARITAAGDDGARITAMIELVLWYADSDQPRAHAVAPDVVREAEAAGQPVLLTRARYADAVARLFATKGVEPYHELVELRGAFESFGLAADAAWCDHMAGVALEYIGDPGGATVLLERALATFRRLGHLRGEARCLNTLGFGESCLGRHAQALANYRRAAELAAIAGCPGTLALARLNGAEAATELGRIALADGDPDAAHAHFTRADADLVALQEFVDRLGHRHLRPLAVAYHAPTLLCLGRHTEALAACDRAIELSAEAQSAETRASARSYAGEVHLALGSPERARELFGAALAAYEQWGLHSETVRLLRGLVQANESLGDVVTAYAQHKRLLTVELALRDANARREDEVAAARAELARIPDGAGQRLSSAELLRQNDRLEAERRALERLAHTDPLTGLANRRHFDAQLARLAVRAHLGGRPLGLVIIDIDHFKRVNDRLSHLTGDALLCQVATTVARHSRGGDLAARIGGEEFALVLPGTGRREAIAVAERLRLAVESLILDDLLAGLRVTVSAGVAAIGPGRSADGLVAAADAALYAAKRNGRNRVCADAEATA